MKEDKKRMKAKLDANSSPKYPEGLPVKNVALGLPGRHSDPASLIDRYCVLCPSYIRTPRYAGVCRLHHMGYVNGKYMCCSEGRYNAGCMRVSHFYIDHKDGVITLTNGESCLTLLPM